MPDDATLSSQDDTPLYTIKTVVHGTGIAPATLRAWERRYGVLSPGRSSGGYRLYSERDIATLRWLKSQVDTGISISQAVALLELRHRAGEEPELAMLGSHEGAALLSHEVREADTLVTELVDALMAYGEARAEALLTEAFSLYPVEEVFEAVVAPALVQIGELWHQGQASIVQEHFATAFLRRRLTALLQAYAVPKSGPLAITGSGPAEWHDIGILLVALVLRRHGWRVIHLGQNVPVADLLEQIQKLRPELVCLSVTTRQSASALAEVYEAVQQFPGTRPRLVFGGRAFNLDPELQAQFPDAYLAASARDLITIISPR